MEIKQTDEYQAILARIEEMDGIQAAIVIVASRNEELGKIRFEAGVREGIVRVLNYLEEL